MTARQSVLGRQRARTLGAVLTEIALRNGDRRVLPPVPVLAPEPGLRGGAELRGSYQLPDYGKPLPDWWPTLRRF